ncbi:hypothetical protein CLOSTMETH_03365 [[Clostridium] methylpentosum DSM 5476]|uniref:DUF1540 domain-containing protein n=1 Tax=[Clostridium] methylpentosum DSM 5476 TaxID=537013 RepID=C0EHM0_9FIRM|nr:hypothetical protein CLOSTMETH_03365 [[Clostridium] methylpentosum DSM 5476]
MNLITCSSNCIHQKDGYCTLDKPSHITGSAVGGCCYFESGRRKNYKNRRNKLTKNNRYG